VYSPPTHLAPSVTQKLSHVDRSHVIVRAVDMTRHRYVSFLKNDIRFIFTEQDSVKRDEIVGKLSRIMSTFMRAMQVIWRPIDQLDRD
jgi:hypothetical protein